MKYYAGGRRMGDALFARPADGHFTASAIILNPAMDCMLMVYHNIYQSWPGQEDMRTALRICCKKQQKKPGRKPALQS